MTTTQPATEKDSCVVVENNGGHAVPASHLLLLVGILLVATGLRLYQLDKPSFWFDEADSVVTACGHWEKFFIPVNGYFDTAPDLASPSGLLPLKHVLLEGDVHPPLYYLLLRGWWVLFGMSEASCRALDVTASLLAMMVLFDVARLVTGPIPALWACAIMAVAPPQVEYAQEARSYAPLLLFGLAACDAALRIQLLGPNRQRLAALGLFACAAVMTHYFAIGGWIGIIVFSAIVMRGRTRIIALLLLSIPLLLVLSRLPLAFANHDKNQVSIQWLVESRDGLIGRTLVRVLTLPNWYLIRPLDKDMALGICGGLLLIPPFFLHRRRPGLLLAGLWSCGVIGMVAAADVVLSRNALLYIRYTLAASPMVYVSFVSIADIGGKWVRHLMPAIVLIGAALALPDMYQSIINRKTEVRQLAGDIRDHVAPGDGLIICSSPDRGLWAAGMEYNEIVFYAWPIPCALAVLEAPASPAIEQQINAHHRIWLANCWGSVAAQSALAQYRIEETFPMRYQAGCLYRVEPRSPSTAGQ